MILDERFAVAVTDQIEELRKHLKRMKDPEALSSLTSSDDALDFCGEHGITADVEVIPIQQINEAFDRMNNGEGKYRFVIEMASLGKAAD